MATRKLTIEPTERQLTYLYQLINHEYHRITDMETDDGAGFTMGAKVASLVDVVSLGRLFGFGIGDKS